MEFHEIANIFPMMSEHELSSLAQDIKQNGLQNAITLCEGKILDGRNRFEACRIAGVEPEYETFVGDDPLKAVISLNLMRRHLDESQRAVIASRMANMPAYRPSNKSANMPTLSQPEAAALFNVSERMIRTVKAIEREAPERIPEIESGAMTATKVYKLITTKARNDELRNKAVSAPSGKYAVILADPPWQYSNSGFNQSAESQYPTMPTDEICSMADMVREVSIPETVLFLWATNPLLPEALKVMESWGFTYKTNMAWIKGSSGGTGIGWYVKSKHELLLIGTKNNTPHPITKPDSYFTTTSKLKHSEKPDESFLIIESMYEGAKLELFSRKARIGWVSYGNES
jgi:N6-adenosine-specific RNA methylase IME4